MKPLLIVYATREGLDPSLYAGAILAASLHLAKHEKEMVHFIEHNRDALDQLPTAFLSVSLSAAGAQDEARPAEYRLEVTRALAKTTDALFEKTGWHPARVQFVAGALMYTKYNVIVRWVMKRIARAEGASTDTTHDHVYTDWEGVDRFVAEFLQVLEPGGSAGTAAGEPTA